MMAIPGVEILSDASSTHYAIVRNEARIAGTIAMPVYGVPASDDSGRPNGGATPAACRIIRLHTPFETLSISWTAVKEGAAPLVPNPYLFSANCIFKSGRRSAAAPVQLAGYVGHGWSMSGEYAYHVVSPIDLNSTMRTGIHPWEAQIAVDNAIIPNVNFVNYLLEALKDKPTTWHDPLYVAPAGSTRASSPGA